MDNKKGIKRLLRLPCVITIVAGSQVTYNSDSSVNLISSGRS